MVRDVEETTVVIDLTGRLEVSDELLENVESEHDKEEYVLLHFGSLQAHIFKVLNIEQRSIGVEEGGVDAQKTHQYIPVDGEVALAVDDDALHWVEVRPILLPDNRIVLKIDDLLDLVEVRLHIGGRLALRIV